MNAGSDNTISTNSQQALRAVVIGSSAGALDALTAILPSLPKDYPYPILIVVHLPADRRSLLPDLFQSKCQVQVKEAEDKDLILPGTVYFAPPDYHLLVDVDGMLSLSSEEPVLYSRPSINVLFEAAADAFDSAVAGIVLTGANSDGALGLRAIGAKGGMTIVQAPQTAFTSEMPQAALNQSPKALVMTLEEIRDFLLKQGRSL